MKRKGILGTLALAAVLSALIVKFLSELALASPTPAQPEVPAKLPAPEIALWVDMKNLVGPAGEQILPVQDLVAKLEETNHIWSQCGIRFVAREVANVKASDLKVPFQPQSQKDLEKILFAVHPNPRVVEGAIPLILAGKWGFYDPQTKLHLSGIGWAVTNNEGKVERLGAMVNAAQLEPGMTGYLIGHELGHALSLEHSAEVGNVMSAGFKFNEAQCQQARRFAEGFLQDFRVRNVGSIRSSPAS